MSVAPTAAAQDSGPSQDESNKQKEKDPYKDPWIDRAHNGVFNAVWRSAMRMDQWFGSDVSEAAYLQTSGSIAPAILYDEFDGFQPRMRFQVDVPLPQLNERFHAFVGRVNRDEYVTERSPGSGAFARQYGPVEDDETLFGIRYRDPKDGGHFDADAGLRLNSPLDPFVKGSYRFMKGSSEYTLFSFRETAFWQNTEKFGVTSRIDVERILRDVWLLRGTLSGTFSQRSEGVKGYGSVTMMRGFPNRRAIAAELFSSGEMDAAVPLGDYGLKFAYRRSIMRDWLVLESRVSVTFPRDEVWQVREANWGVGIGLEMSFGTDEFLARPVTF
ncbi:MAG TPA: hypothetical protein VM146_05355 [Steroidobacteraceae bacterium]|nr:hypothetical protein [Steroidobacteraceae bacterium]